MEKSEFHHTFASTNKKTNGMEGNTTTYYHLINKDWMTLDNHNHNSEKDLLASWRDLAKIGHTPKYVDSLSNEEFCKEWHFSVITTEEPLIEPFGTPLDIIKINHRINTIY